MLTCGNPSLVSLTFLWAAPHLADMRVDLSDIVFTVFIVELSLIEP